LVATELYLKDRKTNFRSFIFSHSYTNCVNLLKIGPADVQVIDLRKIVKKETTAEHKPTFG